MECWKEGGKKSLPAAPFDALRASRFRKGRRPVGTMEEWQRLTPRHLLLDNKMLGGFVGMRLPCVSKKADSVQAQNGRSLS